MQDSAAQALLGCVAAYLGVGVLFAAAFHLRGIGRLDPAAAQGSWGFRVLVTPGIAALWPVLARAWWRAAQERV